MRELELALGKVKVSRPKIINYLEFTPADADKRRFDDVKDGAGKTSFYSEPVSSGRLLIS